MDDDNIIENYIKKEEARLTEWQTNLYTKYIGAKSDELIQQYITEYIEYTEDLAHLSYIIDNKDMIRANFPNLSDTERLTELEKQWEVYKANIIKEGQAGGKRKSKGNSKNVAKKPVVSQKKQSECKEILGKKMKIYKMPDSRKEYVKYKGELLHIADYKNLMKQKANAKPKTKTKTKATQQKAISKTKTKK